MLSKLIIFVDKHNESIHHATFLMKFGNLSYFILFNLHPTGASKEVSKLLLCKLVKCTGFFVISCVEMDHQGLASYYIRLNYTKSQAFKF